MFGFYLWTWDVLPEFDQAIGYVPPETPTDRSNVLISVEAGSFEP